MELKTALLLFWQQRRLVFILALSGAVLGYGLSYRLPTLYQASLTFSIHQATQPESPTYFTYNGHYAQLVAEKYTDTLVGLLRSPELAQQIVTETDLPHSQEGIRTIIRATKVVKGAPQLITIRIKTPSPETSRQIASKLVQAASRQLPAGISLHPVNLEPLLLTSSLSPALFGLAGGIAGLILGLVMVVFVEYWKDNS